MDWNFFGVWVGALLTLFIYSFLYKDNPFYKFAEHLFIGISAGYYASFVWHNSFIPNFWVPITQGQWDYLIPLALGITMLFRFSDRLGWISRYGFAFVVGFGAGLNMVVYLQANVFRQIEGSISPLITISNGNLNWIATITSIIMVVGVVSALVYFYFSTPHRGVVGGTARLGIWFLMVSFGASFGYTVMARISLLVGRMQFLIYDWIIPTYNMIAGP
jgi:hypothetical protein